MGYLVWYNTSDVSRSDIHYQQSSHASDAFHSLVVLPFLLVSEITYHAYRKTLNTVYRNCFIYIGSPFLPVSCDTPSYVRGQKTGRVKVQKMKIIRLCGVLVFSTSNFSRSNFSRFPVALVARCNL